MLEEALQEAEAEEAHSIRELDESPSLLQQSQQQPQEPEEQVDPAVVVEEEPVEMEELEPSSERVDDSDAPEESVDTGTEINASDGDQVAPARSQEQEQEPEQQSADSSGIEQQSREPVASGCEPLEEVEEEQESEAQQLHPKSGGVSSSSSSNNKEIEQESIKQTLHEIISEIDREMEGDLLNEEVRSDSFIQLDYLLFKKKTYSSHWHANHFSYIFFNAMPQALLEKEEKCV